MHPYLVPPGAYRLATGSVQNQNLTVTFTVFADGQEVMTSDPVIWGSSTAYHYDRGTTLPNRHPEGYDSQYVREMGRTIDELVIPDVHGDGSAVQLVFRIKCDNWAGKTNVKLNHWCLRPTVNNY